MIPLPDLDAPNLAPAPSPQDGFATEIPTPRRAEATRGIPRDKGLFAEDFDHPAPDPAEPKVVEPSFSLAELKAARAEAWRAGEEAERQSQARHDAEATRAALTAIALQLDITQAEALEATREAAALGVGLLLDALGVAFPSLRARFGPNEAEALLRALLPALRVEPRATLRLPPAMEDRLRAMIAEVDPELPARITLTPDPTLSPDDLRVDWRTGNAARDVTSAWQSIEDVLCQTGWSTTNTVKEAAYVE